MGKPNFDKLKAKRDVKGLIKLLGDDDPWVREIAVKVLRDISPHISIGDSVKIASALAPMLKDKDQKVRFHAAYALAGITIYHYNNDRDRIAISALIEALIDKNEDVRHEAANCLQLVGQQRAVSDAELKKLTDAYGRLRARGVWEIFAESTAAKDAVPILREALKDKDEDVCKAARHVLRKIKKR